MASGLVAEIQSRDDEEKGWSSWEAHLKDYAAAGVGLAAGAAAVAAAPEELGAGGVALVAVGAGGIVIGVGDTAFQIMHEHWSENVHDLGVYGGIKHSVDDVKSNVGKDVAAMFSGVGNSAKSLWNKVF